MASRSRRTRVLGPPRRLAVALGAAAALVVAAGVWWMVRGAAPDADALPIPGEEDRVTVEVLNGTAVNGLARHVTRELRRSGIDVVYFGTAPRAESTLVIARRGDLDAARTVQRALGSGTVLDEPSPQLLLDVTVVLGPDAARAASARN